jgi:hypothetical protein
MPRFDLSSSVQQVGESSDEHRAAGSSGVRREQAWRRATLRHEWLSRPAVVIAVLLLVLSVPLVVALVVLRSPR